MNSTASYRIPIGIQFLWATILAGALFILRNTPSSFGPCRTRLTNSL